LVAIAADHIRQLGVNRVTVVAVAREAGMSHANVYRFFPSKAGLVEAVAVAWMRQVEMALGDIAGAPDPADDKLERFLLAWAKSQREQRERDPAIYETYRHLWEEQRVSVTAHRAQLRGYLRRIVEEGVDPGPFALRDEERAVGFVADAMLRFVHPRLVIEAKDLTRTQAEARLTVLVRVIVRALVAGAV
jgi:AcrR family transcriptional regulator